MKGLRWRWRVGKGRRGSFGSSGEEARCPIFCALYKPRERERGGVERREKGFCYLRSERGYTYRNERERERVGGLSQGNRFNRWAVEILKSE